MIYVPNPIVLPMHSSFYGDGTIPVFLKIVGILIFTAILLLFFYVIKTFFKYGGYILITISFILGSIGIFILMIALIFS